MHDAYPLAPEQLIVEHNDLSQYNKNAIEMLKNQDVKTTMGKCKKLTPNLRNKKNYVCNIVNLQLYLNQGMILTKIHRIVKYNQAPFMNDYIDFNTNKR